MKIGLIGAGLMGHGMGVNMLAAGHELHVVAHRNREPIEDLVSRGALEASSPAAMVALVDVVVLCVTGTPAACKVIEEITPVLRPGMLVIDTTTNTSGGPEKINSILTRLDVTYVEAPVTGGAQQAREGVLGAIVGCDGELSDKARGVLSCFCRQVEQFGPAGAGARAKLVSNFLALGTAALVIETFRKARALGVDWQKLYELAQHGSGKSVGLDRIAGGAVAGDFKGYKFSIDNSVKDLSYFTELAENNSCNSDLVAALLEVFSSAASHGHGSRMISELLDPALGSESSS
ncbi:NAD(P)-dependent oxidoreductase [Anderseniella sp. Alg231-50]|uniref:NAD(P)-dependent oxidoreductase n=1 Tax=Anderseniella sp. Alg231-50 TaxID=1922226 RepID=UPI00307C8E4C